MCKVVTTMPSLVCLRRTLHAAVPAGHVAVSVQGAAPRRFVVRVAHFSRPAFLELLRQAEEEYGFPACPGPIALPCDDDRFLDVLHLGLLLLLLWPRGSSARARPLLQCMAVEKLVDW